ncbi:MAG: hypothetical protein GY800_08920 [Planctomycetes bacterium]|nr:hypothetical protein [Planctomycetota bacterium]
MGTEYYQYPEERKTAFIARISAPAKKKLKPFLGGNYDLNVHGDQSKIDEASEKR